MPFLKNEFGRIVEVEASEYDHWREQPGFTIPSDYELKVFNDKRLSKIYPQTRTGLPVWFSTVQTRTPDGYGQSSEVMEQELLNIGVDIDTQNHDQKIGFLYHHPYSIMRLQNPIRILYTMFESSKLPGDWKEYLDYATKIIVPSRFVQKLFSDIGYEAEVVPLGYNSRVFNFIDRGKVKRDERKDFVFLHYNAFNVRKGFLEVYNAFVKAFEPTEPVKLYLKTTHPNPRAVMPIMKAQYPNIIIDNTIMKEAELAALCGESDAFIFPSRGEGFGITPLEAMATGLPTIVPNAHGISEYFNANYMYEAKVEDYEAPAIYSRYKNQDVGHMIKCDVDQLAKQMRWIYEHQDEAREVGNRASDYVKQWTYTNTALKLKELFTTLNEQEPTKEYKPTRILPLYEI